MIRILFTNITILLSFLFIIGQVLNHYPLDKDSSLRHRTFIGIIFGIMGIVLMLFTFNITEFVVFDLRNLAIICAGIFGGVASVLISTILIAIYRIAHFGINEASIVISISIILIGIICAYISHIRVSVSKRFVYMFIISTTITSLIFVYLLGNTTILEDTLKHYWLVHILGGLLAYYTCEYIIFSTNTFREMSYFQIMADNLVDLITIHKFSGTYKYASPSSLKLLGYKPEEMVGRNFFSFIHPDELQEILNLQSKLEKREISEYTKELRIKNSDDDYVWVESTFKSIKDSEGKTREVICATRDVMERKRIEDKLRRQTTDAIEANRMKSQFLANMSHELRTPLNSIIGFTTRVLKKSGDALPSVQRENLDIVKEEAQHLLTLINDLLDYSKMEAGKMNVTVEEFDLVDLIDEVSAMTSSISEEKSLLFKKEIDKDINSLIVSDRIKLKQVLLNLLSNAFKYSDSGTITLRTVRQNNYIKIDVIDQGIGIDESELNDIFKEFHQVDGSYTRKVGGTGLGLAITKRFVEILKGRIEARSEIGVGSTFTIYLPTNYNDTDKSLISEELNLELEGINKTDKVIAFIENDFSTRRLYCEYLREEGFTPVPIDDKEDFEVMIERIIELSPHAIILDIILQNKDGWDILNQLKENPHTKHIPVIISSVLNEQKLAYKMRADDYLVKPVLQEDLISAINKITKEDDGVEVLIVDDDKNYLKLMCQYLDETKLPYLTAEDGETAIEMIDKHSPGLVILDLMMPSVTGFEVLDWIRKSEKHKDISVIVVSAKDLTEKERENLIESANMIIHKSGMQVEEVIKQVLEDKRWKKRV